MAVIELGATVGQLRAQELQPFALAEISLPAGEAVRVGGIYIMGLPPAEEFLREEICELTGRADLLEFNWHFFDTYRTT